MRKAIGIAAWCVLLCAGDPCGAANASGKIVVPLTEVSVLDAGDIGGNLLRGQWEQCGPRPSTDVKAYPKLASDKPLFGTITVGRDERKPDAGAGFHFAVDATEGPGKPYDRLYVDVNRDLDLTNDAPRAYWKDSPEKLHFYAQYDERCFERTRISIPTENGGTATFEVIARLINLGNEVPEQSRHMLSAVCATARKGSFKLGGAEYTAVLGQDYILTGRYDNRATVLLVTRKDDPSSAPSWWEGDRLLAMHKLGGTFYRFEATPAGDTLTITPYTGDMGIFEIGKGGRTLDTLECAGSFMTDGYAVAVGGDLENGWPKPAARASIPVGDYLPNYLTVTYGRLQITLSRNYYGDGTPQIDPQKRVYGIAVRKDKPFVFDFGAKPVVFFTQPAKEARVKRGETLQVTALLVDPTLDIMIRGLVDRTKTKKVEFTGPDGQKGSYEQQLSLDPTVVIRRAGGEKAAEGVMPFG